MLTADRASSRLLLAFGWPRIRCAQTLFPQDAPGLVEEMTGRKRFMKFTGAPPLAPKARKLSRAEESAEQYKLFAENKAVLARVRGGVGLAQRSARHAPLLRGERALAYGMHRQHPWLWPRPPHAGACAARLPARRTHTATPAHTRTAETVRCCR